MAGHYWAPTSRGYSTGSQRLSQMLSRPVRTVGCMSEPIVRQRRTPPAGLGPALRTARGHAGLSQSAVARRVGLTSSYLAKLENGTRCPSVTMAGRLAVVLALGDDERRQLLAAAVNDAGADHPYRRAA